MKYPRLILAFLFVLSYTITIAQIPTIEAAKVNKAVCIKLTKELAPTFQLNENEYIKLKSLNMQYLSKVAETNALLQNVSLSLANPFSELESQHEQELVAFLNPQQLQAYKTYIENHKSVLQQLTEMANESHNRELIAKTKTR